MAATNDQVTFSRSPRESPGPRDWILDLYGSFIREFGGWIAVSDLLTLLDSLGVSSTSGRAALSRMKRRGELRAAVRSGKRGYALTEQADRWFADGTDRIMGRTPPADGGLWALATFTVPEEDRTVRYRIRSRLLDLGYGSLSGGMMIAPASIGPETARALELDGLGDHVDIWTARHLDGRQLAEIVELVWDLPAIDAAYREYMVLAAEIEARPAADHEQAFVDYLLHINAWRELPFRDPGIPADCLPPDWPAPEARAMFARIAAERRPAAWAHFVRVVVG